MALYLPHRTTLLSYSALLLLGAGLFVACSSSDSPPLDEEDPTEEDGKGGSKTSSSSAKGGAGGSAGKGSSTSNTAKGGSAGSSKNETAGNSSGNAGTKVGAGGSTGTAGKSGSGGSAGKSTGAGGSKATGGSSANAGSAGSAPGAGGTNAGAGGSGGENTGTSPPGYWSHKEWHGCSWTGVGELGASTITPKDFTTKAAGEPYCAKGTVGKEPEYKGVALMGFNINETNPESCESKPVDKSADGPPAAASMPGKGIAVNAAKQSGTFTLRIQIQGPNGHKDGEVGENDRWCAEIKDPGKSFIPYTDFWTECWGETEDKKGKQYNGEPIDAVVFTVPGEAETDVPYEFCVNGFSYGTSSSDAPDGTAEANQSGTIGGAGGKDKDFDRVKVSVDGETYIIQNNNWGKPDSTDLALSYNGNSFKLTSGTGQGDTSGPPASFPSIYIGANGDIKGGQFSTSSTDNLPIQISNIKSIISTFQYSGSTSLYNATYDIWFANSKPEPGSYDDGINGFVMIWLRDPSGAQAIGSQQGTATLAGKTWNVWKGNRGGSGPNANAPVVSFVNPKENDDSMAKSFTDVDILAFISEASKYGISSSMYLTDVFAGFEIWSGGAGQNLGVDKYTCVVTPK